MQSTRLRLSALAFAACSAFPALTFAAGHAQVSVQSPDKSAHVNIEYDGSLARMQTEEKPNSYFIVKDAHAYAVAKDDGETKVFDMNQVATVLESRRGGGGGGMLGGRFRGGGGGGFGGGRFGDRPKINLDVAEVKSLKDTGKTETVAGVQGNIYTLEYLDHEGNTKTTDAVLSKDSKAREFTQTMYSIGTTLRDEMGNGEGQNKVAGTGALWKQIDDQGLGLLRFGQGLTVSKLDDSKPDKSRFELPAAVTPINSMMDLRQLKILRDG